MKKLIELHKIIESEGILLEHLNFKEKNILGMYYKDNNLCLIGINKAIILDEILYKCILAEELGHHFTSYDFAKNEVFSYSNKIMLCRNELRARRWAVNFLLPDEDYIHALNATEVPYNLADLFCVTEDYIHIKNKTLLLNNSIQLVQAI